MREVDAAQQQSGRTVDVDRLASWDWDPQSGALSFSGEYGDLASHLAPGQRELIDRALRSALGTGTAFALEFLTDAAAPSVLRMLGRRTGGPGQLRLAGMIEDVTGRRQQQETGARADRLASLGTFAAGVAHDFNNVLTVISMRADLLGAALAGEGVDQEFYVEDLEAMSAAAATAAGLTRQLALFAGAGGGRQADVDLSEAIRGLRPLLGSALGGAVEAGYTLAPGLLVRCDPGHVEQVITNLVVNARDAVANIAATRGREPRLSVVARPVVDAAEAARLAARAPARTAGGAPAGWAVLEIVDNGTGMSPAVREKAFDPFFTTRTAGRGTGLGLSVVFGIVERLGGIVDIDSVEGTGTTVRVGLPTVGAAPPPAPVPAPPAPAAATRILLVDDDTAVRTITARILRSRGYLTTAVASAGEALATLAQDPAYALVVSDVVMPGMSGSALAERLLADRPELPILLVSGFAPPKKLVDHPLLALVTKPLTGAALTGAIESLLARAVSARAAALAAQLPVRA